MTSYKIAWKQLFSPTIRSRALSYFRAGKVKKITEEEDGTFTGTVRGTRNYRVTIGIEDGKVSTMACSCPYAEKGETCKHEAAMLYEMEQEGLLNIERKQEEELARPDELALPAGNLAKRPKAVSSGRAGAVSDLSGGMETSSIVEPESGQEKVRAAHEEALRELVKRDIAEASEEEDEETSFVVDNYHFYDTQNMVREARITKSAYRKAVAFFDKDKTP